MHIPAVAEYLKRFPFTDTTGAATSQHWSKVIVNDKAVIAITHLTTFQPEPGPRVPTVLTVSKTVYASRYMNGELTLWMLFAPGDGLVVPGLRHTVRTRYARRHVQQSEAYGDRRSDERGGCRGAGVRA